MGGPRPTNGPLSAKQSTRPLLTLVPCNFSDLHLVRAIWIEPLRPFVLCLQAGLCVLFVAMLSGCGAHKDSAKPSIELTRVPRADKGGGAELDTISGRVIGASGGQQVVLFARSGAWYVQPFADQPFTKIVPDSTWSNSTHLGTDYAALLVEPGYVPPPSTVVLPNEGNGVIAVVVAE